MATKKASEKGKKASARKGQSRQKRLSKKQWLVVGAAIVVMAAVAVGFWVAGNSFHLSINNLPVTREEYLYMMNAQKYAVSTQLSERYGLQTGAGFWSGTVGDTTAYRVLAERTVEALKEHRARYELAKGRGYVDDISYAGLLTRLESENATRAEKLAKGETVYGVERFTMDTFLDYEADAIRTRYCDDASNPGMELSEELLRAQYEETKEPRFRRDDDLSLAYIKIECDSEGLDAETVQRKKDALARLAGESGSLYNLATAQPELAPYVMQRDLTYGDYRAASMEIPEVLALTVGLATGERSAVIDENGVLCLVECVKRTPGGYTPYQVFRLDGESEVKLGDTTASTYAVTGLTADTEYRFLVKAVSASGKTSSYPGLTVRTLADTSTVRPGDVTGLKLDAKSTSGATISWTKVEGAASYSVYLNDELSGSAAGTTYRFTGLTAGSYTVKVLAVGEQGNVSEHPATLTFTIGTLYTIRVTGTAHGSVVAVPEASAGEVVRLTVTADSGYRLKSGSLKYNGVPIAGTEFIMPADNVTITAEFESTGGSSGGGGGSTSGTTSEGSTTLKPSSAESTLTDKDVQQLVTSAKESGSGALTVAPTVSGKDRYAVTLPEGGAKVLAEVENASLAIKTPLAEVTLSAAALSSATGVLTIAVEKRSGGAMAIATGQELPVTVKLPAAGVNIVVLVAPDGTETVLPKSVLQDGALYTALTGDAVLKTIERRVSFADVGENAWSKSAVDFVASRELFSGTPGGTFAPAEPMSRGMLATVLHRLESKPQGMAESTFADVTSSAWYAPGVAWAAEKGIVGGKGSGSFDPNGSVTRQELAVMLYRYAQDLGFAERVQGAGISGYVGAEKVAAWAKEAMDFAVNAGLMTDGGGKGVNPTDTATRAEVATVLQRLVEQIVL